ncbi:membrane-associated serine protease [Companilactobacillus tucceti DSM 20183]|uniref:Membrane-associated serine protease n=1 Tax=Companilactobacillus tucceti DSM 20183 TaxID=1423811 RepID=A0A0R1JCX9_9LACO|nr:rhomboid family intramembrane serine protease [Companilactobacillus tucceti]KRK65618.1 membrane-associated serine protease [Companilactobacillus tucceti DSM 20183]
MYREREPYVTWLLLAVTVFVFVLETLSGGSTSTGTLVNFGAKVTPLIQDGQWWRLITPIFLHIGIFHILMNGFTLYIMGKSLEPLMGHWRFFVLYILSGIVGNLASFAFGGYYTISAGASTSLFGTFAAFLSFALIYRENQGFWELGKSFLTLIVLNLLISLVGSNFDIWGHIGGIIGGFFLGVVLGLPKSTRPKLIIRVVSVIIIIVVSYFMYVRGMNIG